MKRTILILLLTLSGCTKVPPLDDNVIAYTIENRIGSEVGRGSYDDAVQNLIESELSPDSAVQIALLNNPKVQAAFEEAGFAHAELVAAGLFTNPIYELDLRIPTQGGLKLNVEYLVMTSLLDIFLIPMRTKLAAADYEQTQLKVSNAILDLAFEVRQVYNTLIIENAKQRILEDAKELANIIADISARQSFAGTVGWQLPDATLLESEILESETKANIIQLKEKLLRLLGFCTDVCLILPEDVPEVDFFGYDLCALEKIALDNRLDLQIARFDVVRLRRMLGLKAGWTYTKLMTGVSGEQDTDGVNVIGPAFAGDIPIFNYGQAERLRLCAELRQAEDNAAALEISVLSEVREAHALLMNYLLIIKDYREHLLPLFSSIRDNSMRLYNVMGLSIYQLLEDKHNEIHAVRNYLDGLNNYLEARVKLDRALGGNLFRMIP